MTYTKPEVVVLGEATELIKGAKGFGPEGFRMREIMQLEETED